MIPILWDFSSKCGDV